MIVKITFWPLSGKVAATERLSGISAQSMMMWNYLCHDDFRNDFLHTVLGESGRNCSLEFGTLRPRDLSAICYETLPVTRTAASGAALDLAPTQSWTSIPC